ncbi:hypothetical protein QNH20_21840 [Neobacillus sp. WH10]|uniref:hypothetical protein n=1 Tax=Neobacillus sp. WH10 TaxID=3047873 RepID=UPI0024C1E2DC|nr:hypothetical protein [Neobacillus sp. WH10]WHY76705.1 hypothetical protein QNH20_21840 [Neobacillus sp. WH10]
MIIKLRFLLISTKAPDLTKKTPIMTADYYVELPVDSPNAKLIRTGYTEYCLVLSECEAYSDRIRRILPRLVRMRALFGQDTQNIALSCPNAKLIRTGYAEYCLVLSECKPYSDRIRRILPCLVRMQALFGQDT